MDNPSLAFARLVERFAPPPVAEVPGIRADGGARAGTCAWARACAVGPYAVIEDGAEIGDGVRVGAHVFIGAGSVVGADSRIYPHVTIREHSRLGQRVILHSGTVIGGDGFGFRDQGRPARQDPADGHRADRRRRGDRRELTVDRARFGRTHIGEGTKIDNLVQIAHNVVVGPHCILVRAGGDLGQHAVG